MRKWTPRKKEVMKIILDTETCGGMSAPLVYDLGYVIADDNGNIVKMRSYIIKEIYDNAELFNSAYYKEKRPLYEIRLNNGYSKKVRFAYAMYMLMRDMKKYGIDKYAYNSAFDNKSISSTMQYLNKNKYNVLENKIDDIMNYIEPITNTIEYAEFCKKYGFMTKHRKPRPQKKAETLYRYLTNNPNYIEEHTALEDSKIELFILLTALALNE